MIKYSNTIIKRLKMKSKTEMLDLYKDGWITKEGLEQSLKAIERIEDGEQERSKSIFI